MARLGKNDVKQTTWHEFAEIESHPQAEQG